MTSRAVDIPLDPTKPKGRRFFERMGRLFIEEVERELRRHAFQGEPDEIMDSLSWEIEGGCLVIKSDHPAVQYLNRGVDGENLADRLGSLSDDEDQIDQKIPVISRDGSIRLVKPSSQLFVDTGYRPLLDGTHFLDRAFERGKQRVVEEYKKLLSEKTKGELIRKMKDKMT